MLALKVDKKKLFEYSAILGVIFFIIIYIILTNFVIKPKVDNTTDTGLIQSIPIKVIKELDVEIIEDEKFKNLQENVYLETKIEDLNVGKKDPFIPAQTKAKEVIKN